MGTISRRWRAIIPHQGRIDMPGAGTLRIVGDDRVPPAEIAAHITGFAAPAQLRRRREGVYGAASGAA